MDKDLMVSVKNVSMEFNMSTEKVDSLKEYTMRLLKGQLFFESFWALKDVSVDVYRGETLGIVGNNGSGKSTLLKIIAGVMKPTKGSTEIYGSLSPMIELGAGFDPDLTGRENIFLNGAILGHSKAFMDSVYDEIVDFSELGPFIDTPLKNYSSGMQARLAFATSTVVKPEILIVDEVLGVGDFHFQEKCERRIHDLMDNNTTVIFVSHSIEQVKRICRRAIWINKGVLMMDGPVNEVCETYLREST
ncbi:MAG: ABC transporter ATP-binding protein [Oscillospiraceae bacterium]|nr:ABC transporter ATP-binding protein [Oscillospiraceae bacterium]